MRSTILVAACFLTLPASGQIPHYRFTGNDSPDEFGTACRGAGDVDADGFDDLIVGAHYEDGPLISTVGAARVLSGRTGEVLYVFHGPTEFAEMGFGVDGAGDVNGDGHADLIVGAPRVTHAFPLAGSVFVYSGKDGSLLHRFDASQRYQLFGYAVAGVGDLDQDGFPDLVVGAPGAGQVSDPAGRV